MLERLKIQKKTTLDFVDSDLQMDNIRACRINLFCFVLFFLRIFFKELGILGMRGFILFNLFSF